MHFPCGRVKRFLSQRSPRKMRVAPTAAIYTTAVLEYLVVEVLELAGVSQKSILSCVVTKIPKEIARSHNVKRITPRHLKLAICCDEELDTLVRAATASGGACTRRMVRQRTE